MSVGAWRTKKWEGPLFVVRMIERKGCLLRQFVVKSGCTDHHLWPLILVRLCGGRGNAAHQRSRSSEAIREQEMDVVSFGVVGSVEVEVDDDGGMHNEG